MERIVCYGDSNTWGYDPRDALGGRIDPCWCQLLEEKTGRPVCNLGENGRTVPRNPWDFRILEEKLGPGDFLVILLGTNDLLQGYEVPQILSAMEALLRRVQGRDVLLLAPPPIRAGEFPLAELENGYEALAGRLGVPFSRTSRWGLSLAFDGVHLSEAGHRELAEKLAELISLK